MTLYSWNCEYPCRVTQLQPIPTIDERDAFVFFYVAIHTYTWYNIRTSYLGFNEVFHGYTGPSPTAAVCMFALGRNFFHILWAVCDWVTSFMIIIPCASLYSIYLQVHAWINYPTDRYLVVFFRIMFWYAACIVWHMYDTAFDEIVHYICCFFSVQNEQERNYRKVMDKELARKIYL